MTTGTPTTLEQPSHDDTGRLVVGIGCRRGVSAAAIEGAVRAALQQLGSDLLKRPLSATIGVLASIDAKVTEAGLFDFAEQYGLALRFFSAEALGAASAAAAAARGPTAIGSNDVAGTRLAAQHGSAAAPTPVRQRFGIDHVCEAAARTACPTGNVLLPKTVFGDVTVSIVAPIVP